MNYKVKLTVINKNNIKVKEEIQHHELDNPTIAQIKALSNPSTYINIKTQRVVAHNRNADDDFNPKKPYIHHIIKLN
jgi:hypothetical protein